MLTPAERAAQLEIRRLKETHEDEIHDAQIDMDAAIGRLRVLRSRCRHLTLRELRSWSIGRGADECPDCGDLVFPGTFHVDGQI